MFDFLLLSLFVLVLFSFWNSLREVDHSSQIITILIIIGFVTLIFWGVQMGLIPLLAGISEKPLKVFFTLVFLFLIYKNSNDFYQKFKKDTFSATDIFLLVINNLLFLFLFYKTL